MAELVLAACGRCEKLNLVSAMVGVAEEGQKAQIVCQSTCVREGEETYEVTILGSP